MRLILSLDYTFLAALLFALPTWTRPEMLFGVPVSALFRQEPAARAAIFRYRAAVAIAMAFCLGGLLLAPEESLGFVATAGPLALLLAASFGFYVQYRALQPYAVQWQRPLEVELSDAPDQLPSWVWLAAVPFLLLTAAAVYLSLHWDAIPASFPVHWGVDGQPNRWLPRTPRGVYGSLIFAGLLCFYLLLTTFACWFGSRRSPFRRTMLGALIATQFLLGVLFALIALNPLAHFPIGLIVAVPIVFLIPMLVILARAAAQPADPPEVTPNECWKFGVVYYNPDDAALFVMRRMGIGYTLNFASPMAWGLLLAIIPVLGSAAFLV